MYKKILLAYDGSDAGQQALLDCREIVQMEQSECSGLIKIDSPIGC